MTLTLIQSGIFSGYVSFILIKFGVLPSISDSWYRLKGLYKSLFTWFCFSLGATMLFQTDGTTPLFFVSGAGLCLTGVAAEFDSLSDKTIGILHFTGAVVCIFGALLGLGFERGDWISIIVFVVGAIAIKLLKFNNTIWWIEISAFCCIIGGLLMN